jgi:hypothetical protein
MRKLIYAAIVLCLCSTLVVAQTQKEYSHHVGVQTNLLLEQLINFGNSPQINNPFLLKYGLRNNEKQTELMIGFGFDYDFEEEENGLKSRLTDLDLRIGYAKKMMLNKRFELGYGLDAVFSGLNARTVNIQAFGGGGGFVDSTITTTRSYEIEYGLGPQFTLDFYITPTIKIGTEATFYFLSGQNSFDLTVENWQTDFGGNLSYSRSDDEDQSSTAAFNFQVPVALYLTVVF